ncbi:MAG: hypothetical protein J0H08_03070 [Rhizobiales bacterium]|nr:hypothetical protein [Hyphomicrobiales bacterium]
MECSTAKSGRCAPANTRCRSWSFRWRGGPEQLAEGVTAAAAAFALGYGFDDFKDLTWEERR